MTSEEIKAIVFIFKAYKLFGKKVIMQKK
jgi:hypothetical protein